MSTSAIEFEKCACWSPKTSSSLITKAEKRIWVVLSKIDDLSCAEKIIEKAVDGVDVRIILNNWMALISAIDSFIYKRKKALKRAKILVDLTRSLKRAMIIAVALMSAYVGISLYLGITPFGIPIAWPIAAIILPILAIALYRKMISYAQSKYDKATKMYTRAQTVKTAIGRNLKATIIPFTWLPHRLCIIDDTAWTTNGSGPTEAVDVKKAEEEFAKLWKKADRPIFKLFNDIIAAEKRIWVAAPKIEYVDAELLVTVASMASKRTDVRVVTNDTENLTLAAGFYSWLIRYAKSSVIKWTIEFLLLFILGAVFIITPIVYIALGKPIFPTFIAAYLPLLLVYILWVRSKINVGHLNYVANTIKDIETKIGEISLIFDDKILSLKRNLNVIKAPVAEELYIVDDKAWVNHNGELKEIDVEEAKERFKELLNKYQPTADHKA